MRSEGAEKNSKRSKKPRENRERLGSVAQKEDLQVFLMSLGIDNERNTEENNI